MSQNTVDQVKFINEFPFKGKLLAQSRPSGTGAASIFTLSATQAGAQVHQIIVCNTTGSSANYSIFFSLGTTYDQTTALFYATVLAANTTNIINIELSLFRGAGANLAVQSGTGSAITYSVFGELKSN